MIRKIAMGGMVALMAASAHATIYQLTFRNLVAGSPNYYAGVQQTVPTANTATGVGRVFFDGIWTWDDVTNTLRQTGSNRFAFGPALPASVAYVWDITNMVATGTGATSASAFRCWDGNFANVFIFASICGGYGFGGDFIAQSTISADACTRTMGGDDVIDAPTMCITNVFNQGTGNDYRLVLRDTTLNQPADTLYVRGALMDNPDFDPNGGSPYWGPTASYGAANAGWEFQFDIGAALPDGDGDGIANIVDNCASVANANQLDTNGDGYGNACDADINNSNLVTTADFNLLRSVLNQACPTPANTTACNADLNGSGLVTTADFNILRSRLNQAPGPSGLACAGAVGGCPVPAPATFCASTSTASCPQPYTGP